MGIHKNEDEHEEPIIEVNCIKHVYPDGTKVELCGLSFKIYEGEIVAILGPNGAGKTTLLLHILGVLEPSEGFIKFKGKEVSRKDYPTIRKYIGFVFQNPEDMLFAPTVEQDVAFGPINMGLKKDEVKERVEWALKAVGAIELTKKVPHYLSFGQKKRVSLACVLSMRPKVLVLDEPFAGLDPKGQIEIAKLLKKLNRDYGITIVYSTHNVDLVPMLSRRVYLINKGILWSGDPIEMIFNEEVLRSAGFIQPLSIRILENATTKRGEELKKLVKEIYMDSVKL
ncbi:MAG: energy-coupling factor ABC transporter ATP-binding protein [Candidatus Asgardarchaeia archaeon]